jgi:hypothetical protein
VTALSRVAPFAPAAPVGAADRELGTDPGRDLLAARQATHGDFAETATLAQAIKGVIGRRAASLPPMQREALDQIATKLARILAGDANHADHWDDVAGYARLAAASLAPDNSVT